MSFQFNGLKAAVSISGTVATGLVQPSATQTPLYYSANEGVNAAYATKLTPTAGKTIYLTDLVVQGGGSIIVYIADNGTEKFEMFTGTASQSLIVHFVTPIRISTTLQLKNSAGIIIFLGGYEV